MKIGIDAISFATSDFCLKLDSLAEILKVDKNKFLEGLGQKVMSVASPDEDIITLAVKACMLLQNQADLTDVNHLLFATESGLDYSKSAGIYVHHLLKLNSNCSVLEIKQACYSGTAAIHMGYGLVKSNIKSKILVIASDISHYGFGKIGESSQGCGAVAMVIKANPKIIQIEPFRGFYTRNIRDFWRPNYLEYPVVHGKFSENMYYAALAESWKNYSAIASNTLEDHDYICYHTPVPKIVQKAHYKLLNEINQLSISKNCCNEHVAKSLVYASKVGNCYSASLYLSLLSLLEQSTENLANKRIGFFSYGAGCVAEFFSGTVRSTYTEQIKMFEQEKILSERVEISYKKYKKWYSLKAPKKSGNLLVPCYRKNNQFPRLLRIAEHERIYEL